MVTGLVLVVLACTTGGDAGARAADKVGQNPTDAYSDGRAADVIDADGRTPYVPGIDYSIEAVFKFHKK